MEEKELIRQYFRNKYPDKRYEFKVYHVIKDMFGVIGNNLYIVEFIDSKMKYPKTLELRITYDELYKKGE